MIKNSDNKKRNTGLAYKLKNFQANGDALVWPKYKIENKKN